MLSYIRKQLQAPLALQQYIPMLECEGWRRGTHFLIEGSTA